MQEAYVIGNIIVKDEVKWEEYKSKVTDTLIPFSGELVFRGHKTKNLSGNQKHPINVIIKFPNNQDLNNWFESTSYQSLISIRELAADVILTSYQSDS
ncbi:MAG: hypothetical protein ACI9TV_001871 [Sulfurimonas sp.]|jgi:uncharacterized protein (DUF1330 family)|uniref:DUF1330 domain-containing protein n=1 Tax=Sulfurimonas sp. TaxID=2022749 RepID=UPI0039E4CD32